MEKDELFKRLYDLLEKMNDLDEKAARELEAGNISAHEQLEEESMSLYKEYFDLIHKEIEESYRKKAEEKIGYGHFTSTLYLDALKRAMKNERTLCQYRGYTLKKDKDPFGAMTYWIFDPYGRQVEESFDFASDETAVCAFCQMVEEGDFSSNMF